VVGCRFASTISPFALRRAQPSHQYTAVWRHILETKAAGRTPRGPDHGALDEREDGRGLRMNGGGRLNLCQISLTLESARLK